MIARVAPFKVITGRSKSHRAEAARQSRLERAEAKSRGLKVQVLCDRIQQLAECGHEHLEFIDNLVTHILRDSGRRT